MVPDIPGKKTRRVPDVFVHRAIIAPTVVPTRAVGAFLADVVAAVRISAIEPHTADVGIALIAEVGLNGSPHRPGVAVNRGTGIKAVDQKDSLIECARARLRRPDEEETSAEKDDGDKRQSETFRHVRAFLVS